MAKSERLILVIDEHPYLAPAEKGSFSLLRYYPEYFYPAAGALTIV